MRAGKHPGRCLPHRASLRVSQRARLYGRIEMRHDNLFKRVCCSNSFNRSFFETDHVINILTARVGDFVPVISTFLQIPRTSSFAGIFSDPQSGRLKQTAPMMAHKPNQTKWKSKLKYQTKS